MKPSQSEQSDKHPEELLLLYVEELLGPSAKKSVENHVATCPDCAETVRRLLEMTQLLRTHGEAFCPEPWELAQIAGDGTNETGALKRHLQQCARCRDELERLNASEETNAIPGWFTEAVRREYPASGGAPLSWSPQGFFRGLVGKLTSLLPRPALALSAAAACLMAVVFLSRYPIQEIPVTALSMVDWDQASTTLQSKNAIRLMGPGRTKVKAAVVIRFASKNDAPGQLAVDEMYVQLNPRDTLKSRYEILSPHQIAEAVGEGSFTTRPAQDLSGLFHTRLGVSLVAIATIQGSHDGFTIDTRLMDAASREAVYENISGPVPSTDLARHIRESIIRALEAQGAS